MSEKLTFTRDGTRLTKEQAELYLRVMRTHFPDRTVLSMVDRGTWVRRIIQVTLDGDDIAYIKIFYERGSDFLT